ncbi:plexin-C1-like protein [Labeo rohita]|uniref:Plexin-C1-like protein n=1 Tax=Labeo rohita TaxID=84645 RepID=A0A498MLX7_LABRO|nr:plexin-C1-like protein [Labeo rohita]
MRHDLYEEKRKDITNAPHHNRVNILVPFDVNGTLITCGTFQIGYCEVLDINDITNSIYYENYTSVGPRQDEKSVAFIVGQSTGRYLLVGKKGDEEKTPFTVVTLWSTLQSQIGGIFSKIAEGSDAAIQSTVRDVEFIDGFQQVSPSQSYLFLNTKTDYERKVLVLWMNSSKRKKTEIIRSLQAATIRCCSDKVRPVLVASTVIPSVNSVIWAGVFSAQNQQDPENSALALYDISNVQGHVNGFCAYGENPCGSQSGSELQPLNVVFKYSSMSAVAAVRTGPWIVLFIGTSDGQLIKLVLDEKFTAGCPIVLYKSDDEQAVFPKMHFDPVDFKHIYIALKNQEPEIFSLEPNRSSFHGRNNVLLRGRNLENVTKIRIRGDLDCIPKESPVFDRSSDTLRFHIPPSATKGTVKVCVVTPDDRCHGNSIITYSSQPRCTGIQPNVTWSSGGRKIHVQGSNMELVESVTVPLSNKVLQTQYTTSSGDVWFHSHPYDGRGQFRFLLNVENSTVDCGYLAYESDPKFIEFTTIQVAHGLQVNIQKKADLLNLSISEVTVTGLQADRQYQCVLKKIEVYSIICEIAGPVPVVDSLTKKADMLNLSMNEVTVMGVQGDQQYQCILEKIESNVIICKKGKPGAVPVVDSLTITVGNYVLRMSSANDVVNYDSDIKNIVVGNSKLFVLIDHRLHQMRHDLYEEKRKDITRVNILVPFDTNSTLIMCGTFEDGYCEVLDINDITNSIYYESKILVGPRQDEKSVAFIAGASTGRYLLVAKKDDDANSRDNRFTVVTLWNTLQSQHGGIFSNIARGTYAIIQSTVRDVEFVDGFQQVSSSESYLFLNAKTDYERKVLVLRMNSSKENKIEIIKSLQAATIRCCSDKVRPVLVASTVIRSANNIIWAGVFSAQNQQDPENSALALYDISKVQGRVKEFCPTWDRQCDSKLVLDEKFTAGCPIVLYKSDDERAVLPKMHFDPVDFKHIYIALRKQDACKDLHSETDYKEPEILTLEPNKVSFHGRNNVLLRGRNLENVNKIRIQGDLDCISKESPVFDRSSDTLRFHIPPSATKGTVKVCVVTPDNRCHGNSIITYSSQPSCTGIQPTVTWSSGGRKIHIQGSNLELVESVTVLPTNKVLKTQYSTSSEDVWFHSPPYDGSGQFKLSMNVGNTTVDCVDYFLYWPDPEFIRFITFLVANDLQVNIQKKTDMLNLRMNEVNVTGLQGDQQYQCVLQIIESNAIICKIKGESGAVTAVDSLTIGIGDTYVLSMGETTSYFCVSPQNPSGQICNKMKRYLLGILVLMKYCICDYEHNFDGDIKDFVVGNSKLFVLTDHRLHQMRLDLYEEKRKDITNAPHHNRVNILVPFDANGTLITCGTFEDGYCEVLDINDITNSIHYESNILVGPRQDEKYVAFVAGRYLLVGKKDDDAKPQHSLFSAVTVWSTLESQPGGIFSRIAEGTDAIIRSTVRDVEFVDGFQRVSPSQSYFFLNANTDYERKVIVLWLNSSKEKKREIIKTLQAATIRCCSDKVRPVLVASTVIPSVNGVIWAGVFSAQNQQDPENSALALYNISNVQGHVNGFCTIGEKPCGSESGSELQPLSVVFKYISISAVAAMRSESWIVLFIGTSDGQLIKVCLITYDLLVLDEKFTPGCPIVLFKSDDERAVFPKMHFDPVDFKHIYIALRKQLRRVSVVQCAKYNTLKDCTAALDPLCGWCVNSHRKILSLEPTNVSFHGRNNVLVRGRNLESVTKIRIQRELGHIPKECPVFDRSSDTLRFHIPPSATKGTVNPLRNTTSFFDVYRTSNVDVGGTSISGGRKIHVLGSNMEFVESVIIRPFNKVLKTQYNTSSGDVWFHSSPYDGSGQFSLLLNVGNSTVDCGYYLSYRPDPKFLQFTPFLVANDLQVNIQISIGDSYVLRLKENTKYFCISPQNPSGQDVWFDSPPYDGSGQFRLLLNVGNSTVDCVDYFLYQPDPEFTGFSTVPLAKDLQVNIQKKTDMLNLSTGEVNVRGLQGDQQRHCVLERIETNAIICVFSAQNQQDPENSALALYDISNIQGQVKGFCPVGERQCDSELMLDEKFTPGCPTVLYKSDDERAVFPRMHFDPVDFKHIYIALRKQITLHLSLSLESTGNPTFSCTFTTGTEKLCDGSDLPAVFPNCSCSFSDLLLYSRDSRVSATVTIEDQKITETLTVTNCSSITDNSPSASYTECVQCISSGCHWSSSSQRCDWTDGNGPQLKIQKLEILSLEPNKVLLHGRNNILLRGRNLESVTKIRIQGNPNCIPKESPVFDRSSDTLRFHIPPSETKGTVKVCVVTPDDRCHGNSIITYSSQPRCTRIQPNVTWSSGGRKIHVQGSNMELVESVTVPLSNKVQKTQYSTSSGDVWFHSYPYDGRGQFRFLLNVGNSTVDCGYLSYESDPKFTEFTTLQVASDLQVNIQKKADLLNLSINEVTVTGLQADRQYQCVLEKIEANSIICKIKGEAGTVPVVDLLTIKIGNYVLGMSNTTYQFCLSRQNTPGQG